MRKEEKVELEGWRNRRTQITVAVIAAAAARLVAIYFHPGSQNLRKYTGRVVSAVNGDPIGRGGALRAIRNCCSAGRPWHSPPARRW